MKEAVRVHGRDYEITIVQKSKTVWMAYGKFDQVLIAPGSTVAIVEAQGRTFSGARNAWMERARYLGN